MGKYTYLKTKNGIYIKDIPKRLFSFLLIFILSLSAFAQNKTIEGTVMDKNGEPLIGVSVKVKNTTIGTISDIDGKFKLDNVTSNSTLVISFISFKTQEIVIGNRTNIQIVLEDDAKLLDEIVVIGYGTMRKKDLTGSIVQIRPDRLANESPKTIQDILRGTPGLQVGMDASAKGGGSMQLRGQRSVYDKAGHNEPLIILDGMMFYGELSEINPDDIGQIDVLKDASAASIYGAKAASGVIIITTKKGKLGKPIINVSTSLGINTKSSYRKVFGADAYMKYREDWYRTPSYGVNPATGKYEAYQTGTYATQPGFFDHPDNLGKYGITQDQWAAYTTNAAGESMYSIYAKRLGLEDTVLENYLAGKTYDWYDQTFRTGINQDYNVSVAGASERINYYMSIGLLKAEGAVKGNDYQTVRANLKVEGKVTNWLDIGANINFQDRSDGDIQVGLKTDYWEKNQIRNSPYSNYRNPDGSLAQYPMGAVKKWGYNFDFERQYEDLEKGYNVFNTIFNARVKLPYNITYSFNASPRYQYFYDRYFTSAEHPDRSSLDSGVNREQSKRFDWSLNNTITWDYTFAQKHHTVLTLVQEAEERRFWKDRIEARDIQPSDALGFHNTANGTKTASSFSSEDTHQTADALLARLFYSYDERYMITASVRRDGYSAFGNSNPYATFPAVALGWTFTNENFFKWKPMSMGKLRLSWGENGNRSLEDPYVSLANLSSGTGATMGYIDGTGKQVEFKYLGMDRLANPYLRWEKTQSTNLGLDFGFLNDRITGSVEYYDMATKDMIMGQRLPIFSGFGSITTNLGEVQNRGFEFTVNTLNMKTNKFEWRTTFGISYNQNKIKHLYYEYEDVLDGSGNIIGRKERDDTSNGWFIGQPIGVIWDYKVTGIWQADEADEAKKYGQVPGDPKVANIYTADDKVNADGSITPVYNDKDKVFLGKKNPPIHWSLRNEFTLWKDLDVSFSIYSYMGHKSLSGNYLNGDNAGSLVSYNYNVFSKGYWTPENPTNKYARLAAIGPNGATGAQKVYDRSFIRLDNISVGYALPKAWTTKYNLERVKFYATVRNVAVWKKDWEYGDPETGDLATRTYTFGLNLTF